MKTLSLALLLFCFESASAQSVFGGFAGSLAKDNIAGVSGEFGVILEQGPAFSLEFGMVLSEQEIPYHSPGRQPTSNLGSRHWVFNESDEMLLTLNGGAFLSFGLGIFASVGVSRLQELELTSHYVSGPEQRRYYFKDSKAALYGNFGGDLRYRSDFGYLRGGYASRRGALLGLGLIF